MYVLVTERPFYYYAYTMNMGTISQSYAGIVGIFELSCKIMMDITLTIATLVLYTTP